ncbi:TonB-dependent receptor [Spirosoma foliorum]|uniref:TonB-dependent receptor n=1 Tax=Spirosoma foliorum TaxID=2710596 RepID=UPI0035AB7588
MVSTVYRAVQSPSSWLTAYRWLRPTLNSLDLSNIDRVEVVQGAASASIYGAQGANGVIQDFTKRVKKGLCS